MWIIKKEETDENFNLISEKNNYTVGRTSADLILSRDDSISRSHAIFHINTAATETLQLEDIGSKYGTFINENIENNVKLNKGEKIELYDGDRVRFGVFKNIWHVSRATIISAISGLSSEDAQIMKQYMSILGGKLVDQCDANCTHLTMNSKKLTVKALHGLIEQRSFVTLNYWRDFVQAARRGRTTLPLPDEYKPTHCDDFMQHNVDFSAKSARKHIFEGMTFVFMNRKQLEIYGPIVSKASGVVRSLNAGVQKTFLLKDKVAVVQYAPFSQLLCSQTAISIENFLATNSLRLIPEYEIGLAIVYCSTEKFCNSRHSIIKDIMPSTSSISLSTNTCFAENTEVTENKNTERTELFICDTEENAVNTEDKSESIQNPIFHDESMSPIRITESVEENIQAKRKRTEIGYIDSDESDVDENLFQFTKRMHVNDAVKPKSNNTKKVTSKAKPKPLPIISIKTKTINVNDFQEKSQVQSEYVPQQADALSVLQQPQATKRPIIAVLSDNDDSDSDLFNFDGEPSKKTRFQDKDDDSGEELFDSRNKHNDSVDHPFVNSEKSIPSNIECVKRAVYDIPKPKPLPQKITTTGWLMTHNCVIDEESDNMAEDGSTDDQKNVVSFKGWVYGQAKILNISTSSKASSSQLAQSSLKDVGDSFNSRNNFKRFNKKTNIRPQQSNVPTVWVSMRC